MSNFKIRQSLLGNFDNAEEDKIKKQQFLITNIVEAGYDKQEFAEYMANWKDNGTDIDEWSLIELMDMVHDFQKQHHKIRPQDSHHVQKHDEHKEEDKDQPKGKSKQILEEFSNRYFYFRRYYF